MPSCHVSVQRLNKPILDRWAVSSVSARAAKRVFRGTRLQIARQGVHRLRISLPPPLPENSVESQRSILVLILQEVLTATGVASRWASMWTRGVVVLLCTLFCRLLPCEPITKRRLPHVTWFALVERRLGQIGRCLYQMRPGPCQRAANKAP